jgi:predicted dehydrogenase
VVCACDRNPSRLRQFGRTWRVTALYTDYREMVREQEIDILSLCTDPAPHLDIVTEAAGRVPLIFCEKPMGRDLREAKQIDAVCRTRCTKLAVNLHRLFDPAHRAVGRFLHRGLLGRIQRVNCFYGKGLRNMGVHVISLLLSYFGRMTTVRTLALRSLGDVQEPTADFLAQLEGDVPCVLQGCDFQKYRIFEIDILGDRGRITLDREGFGFQFYRVAANRAESGARELRRYPSPVRPTVGRALYWAIQNLVSVLDYGREPLSTAQMYLQTEAVLEAVFRSANRQGRLVLVGP